MPINKYLFADGTDIKTYVPANPGGGYINVTPTMTSNTTPSPYVISADGYYGSDMPYKAFDGNPAGDNRPFWNVTATRPSGGHWLKIDFGSTKVIQKIDLKSRNILPSPSAGIKDWILYGSNDDINYTQIASGTHPNTTNIMSYTFTNQTGYRYYRINLLNNYAGSSPNSNLIETMVLYEIQGATPAHWKVVGAAPVTKAMFDSDGMTDLSIIDNNALQQLTSAAPELLCWTDEATSYSADLTPQMNGNTSPSPYAVNASASVSTAWLAFDHGSQGAGTASEWVTNTGITAAWISFDFGAGGNNIVTQYTITGSGGYSQSNSPKSWTFEGSNDNTNWTVLDTQTNQTAWGWSEKRTFKINNTNPYRYYRLNITAVNGGSQIEITEIEMMSGGNPPSRTLNTTAVPNAKLILPVGDINVGDVQSFTLATTLSGSGDIKVLVSGDGGMTWKGNGMVAVDPSDLSAVKANGYTPAQLNALTSSDWKTLIPNGQVRFAFYLEQSASADKASVDQLTVNENVYTLTPTVSNLSVLFNLLNIEYPTYYVSRDDGVTWKQVQPDQLTKLDDLPTGKSLRIKAVLKNGQELDGISYSWI
jgi:hypothetical protein